MTSQLTAPVRRRPVARALHAITLAAAAVIALAALAPGAAKAESVPCASIGGDKYECGWWRPGNGTSGGSIVVNKDADGKPVVVGYLRMGRNWIVCQELGSRVTSNGNWNEWYGWTQSDPDANGETHFGWASALDASGGTDGGDFGGVPPCAGRYGPAPSTEGPWETFPPGGSPPPDGPVVTKAYDTALYRAGEPITVNGGSCTSGFPVVIDGRVFGLTGGGCGEVGATVDNPAWTPPQQWEVQRDLFPTSTPLRILPIVDALTFGTPHGLLIGYAQEIDQGESSTLPIDGIWRRDQLSNGSTVCFVGGSAGTGSCGPLTGPREDSLRDMELLCTELAAQTSDAGAPVYSPAYRGLSRAVGVASPLEGKLCYEPIDEVLDRLGATLATGMVSKPTGRKRFPLRSVALAAHSFSAQRGLRLTVRLARAADVFVKLRRAGVASKSSHQGAWRTVRLHGRAGRNRVHVTQVQGRRLARGRYEARLRASFRGVRSDPVPFVFRIR
ncbi:MAG TPA: hypothetical protein VKB25_14155 [Conexibacter sp.]|nr:hypothetical protein [Conexibacter sp.]